MALRQKGGRRAATSSSKGRRPEAEKGPLSERTLDLFDGASFCAKNRCPFLDTCGHRTQKVDPALELQPMRFFVSGASYDGENRVHYSARRATLLTISLNPLALLVGVAGLIALQGFILAAMGQPPICECGYVKLWHGLASSPETSQHLTDWYTFSHVIHGIAFYLILRLVAPDTPLGLRFALAIGLEAGWEILENTPLIIDRYRQSALAEGYFGDSIINSIFDTLASAFGFVLAWRLPVWSVVVLVLAIEIVSAFMIRDNLILNIIQLVYPSEAISRWQLGG